MIHADRHPRQTMPDFVGTGLKERAFEEVHDVVTTALRDCRSNGSLTKLGRLTREASRWV
jgi:hypothetical protein